MIRLADAYIQFELEDRQVLNGLGRIDNAFRSSAATAEIASTAISGSFNRIGSGAAVAGTATATAARTSAGAWGAIAAGAGRAVGSLSRFLGVIGLITLAVQVLGSVISSVMKGAEKDFMSADEKLERMQKRLEEFAKSRDTAAKANATAIREEQERQNTQGEDRIKLEKRRADDARAQAREQQRLINNMLAPGPDRRKEQAEIRGDILKERGLKPDASLSQDEEDEISAEMHARFLDKLNQRRAELELMLKEIKNADKNVQAAVRANIRGDMEQRQAEKAKKDAEAEKFLKKQMLAEKEKDNIREQELDLENRRLEEKIAADKAEALAEGLGMLDQAAAGLDKPGKSQFMGATDLARNIQQAIMNDQTQKKREEMDKARNGFLQGINVNMAQAAKDLKENLHLIGRLQ
jgi:hypothetical protein